MLVVACADASAAPNWSRAAANAGLPVLPEPHLPAGFFFGRTPLIKLSPKKTWEGFLGGCVGTGVGLTKQQAEAGGRRPAWLQLAGSQPG